MILVLDNAPYHHNIPLGPVGKMNKATLADYLVANGCSAAKPLEVGDQKYDPTQPSFRETARAGNIGQTAAMPALRTATIAWFRKHNPKMLESVLVTSFKERGWSVLFTPPYCPDLQPIELFWAAGKNWARLQNLEHRRKVKQCIADLRDGWYGGGPKKKDPCDCGELVKHMLKKADERVKFDEFLEGSVQSGLSLKPNQEGKVCELETGIDQMGRATRMMGRYTSDDPFQESGVLNDTGVQGDDNEVADPDEDEEEVVAEAQEEAPAAVDIPQNAPSMGRSMRAAYGQVQARMRESGLIR